MEGITVKKLNRYHRELAKLHEKYGISGYEVKTPFRVGEYKIRDTIELPNRVTLYGQEG